MSVGQSPITAGLHEDDVTPFEVGREFIDCLDDGVSGHGEKRKTDCASAVGNVHPARREISPEGIRQLAPHLDHQIVRRTRPAAAPMSKPTGLFQTPRCGRATTAVDSPNGQVRRCVRPLRRILVHRRGSAVRRTPRRSSSRRRSLRATQNVPGRRGGRRRRSLEAFQPGRGCSIRVWRCSQDGRAGRTSWRTALGRTRLARALRSRSR